MANQPLGANLMDASLVKRARRSLASPLLAANLNGILLRLLPSPEIKLAAQQLCISNHLDMIHDDLWAVNAIIVDARLRAVKEPDLLNKWLRDINTVIVDVQNILEVIQDSFLQFEQQKQEVTVSPYLLTFDGSISSITTLFLSSYRRRHSLLVDLKQVAQSLNCLLSRVVAFGLQKDMLDSMDPKQPEYYSILWEEVVGIDDDINKLLQIIFQLQQGQPLVDISDDASFIVAITGKLGMGKSTLARMIYYHPLVCKFFKHRIWVDIFNYTLKLDHRQIAKECVRSLTGRIWSDIDIWSLLRRLLYQTRFLIILNELYEITMENKEEFEELKKNLLSFGAPGSRVIVICRSYSIAENDKMAYSDKEYKLKGISLDSWTKLFWRYRIPTAEPHNAKQNYSSVEIKYILNQDEMLLDKDMKDMLYAPIIAKLSGTTSRYNFTFLEKSIAHMAWTKHVMYEGFAQIILYSELLKLLPLSTREGCIDMLIVEGTFTYSVNFARHLQKIVTEMPIKCPEEKRLYDQYAWGIRKSIYHSRMRDGKKFRIPPQCRYLCILVDSHTSTFLTNLPAKIANNLRVLMLYKVKKEMDLQLEKDHEASSIEIPNSLMKNVIILSIIDVGIPKLPSTISILFRLRYLNISNKEIEEVPESICDLYNLRVFILYHCKKLLKAPKQIHKLIKLQILRLAYCTKLQKLPKSITRLVNLQVLDIEACYWLKELPEELRHLERLMNLHMIGCASLTQIPIGISKLINLTALSGYIVEDNDYTLQELQFLARIEQLHIRHLECVLNLNAIASINMKEKRYLENLLLHWEWWNMDMSKNDQLESFKVLDGLQPNVSHLKSLEIISYLGMQFPNWMMMDEQLLLFKSLVEIRLVNLKRCENLPLLDKLHSLASLEMSGMDSLTCVGSTISNDKHTFPRLVKLILSEMPTLVQWNLRCPYLQELTLIHCPKLINIYGFELKTKLTIWLQSELLGRTYFDSIFKNIKELEIVGCHELRQLPEDIKKCKDLRILSIIRCSKLRSLPNWLQNCGIDCTFS